jgi:hypothetical protein
MTVGRYEEALESLRERFGDRVQDIVEILSGYKATDLRKKAEERDAAVKRAVDLEAENARIRAKSKLSETLRRYGVDLDQLRPAEWAALTQSLPESGVIDEDWVAEQVSSLRLPLRKEDR